MRNRIARYLDHDPKVGYWSSPNEAERVICPECLLRPIDCRCAVNFRRQPRLSVWRACPVCCVGTICAAKYGFMDQSLAATLRRWSLGTSPQCSPLTSPQSTTRPVLNHCGRRSRRASLPSK